MMRKFSISLAVVAIAATAPLLAHAQPSPAETDRALDQQRQAMRAAYASHDSARIAAEQKKLQAAYHNDWVADHPPSAAEIARADAHLAQAKENQRRAYDSHDKAWLASAKAELQIAYHQDYMAHHYKR